jgi:hypothetical protein
MADRILLMIRTRMAGLREPALSSRMGSGKA